jgi:hypothetical protein
MNIFLDNYTTATSPIYLSLIGVINGCRSVGAQIAAKRHTFFHPLML